MSGAEVTAPTRIQPLGAGYSFRLLSAWEAMECRREGKAHAAGEEDEALWMNACLLARALQKGGKAAYPDGEAVIRALTAGQIACLAGRWAAFDRENDAKPWDEKAVEETKKGWGTRLMSAFSGVC